MNDNIRLNLPRPMFEYIFTVLANTPLRWVEVAPVLAELDKQAKAPPAEVVPLTAVSSTEGKGNP